MRRPAGVIIAAVVLGLMTLLGILGSLLALIGSFVMHPPVNVPGFRVVMVGSVFVGLFFFVYCAWTVVDLFRMRRWARVSAVVIGGLLFAFSALAGVGMLAARHLAPMIPSPGPTPVNVAAIFVLMALFYFFVSLIGLWWVVYFCLPSVRAAFNASHLMVTNPDILPPGGAMVIPVTAPATPGWRIVIVVWACLMLMCSLVLPITLAMRAPLFLFGAILSGRAEVAVLVAMAVLWIYMGIGLILKWKPAWYVALFWQIYSFAYTLTFLIPGMWGKFIAYQEQLAARWSPPDGGQQAMITSIYHGPFMVFCFLVGVAIVAVVTVALFQRKEDYLGV